MTRVLSCNSRIEYSFLHILRKLLAFCLSAAGVFDWYLKVPGPIASDFFSNFRRFWYQKKTHIFLITHGEFYS